MSDSRESELPARDSGTPSGTVFHARWEAPYPPPNIIEGYERIVPGAGDRLLTMVESEQTHRLLQERKELEESVAITKRGQIFGFMIALCAFGVGGLLAARGQSLSGFGFALLCMASILGTYMYGHKAQKASHESIQDDSSS